MKNKIIGIIISILMVTTVVSATLIDVKEHSRTTTSGENVPEWKKGDSWTFNEQYINHLYNEDGSLLNLWYHNCTSTYTVINVTGDTYTVKMSSTNNDGYQMWDWLRWKYTPLTKFTIEITQRKTDLAYIRFTYTEKGLVLLLLGKINLPFPAQFYDTWVETNTPPLEIFPFPLIAETTGTLANYSWMVHETSSFYWGVFKKIFDYSSFSYVQNYTCEIANITVPAGTYNTYNVSVDSTPQGYSHFSTWSYYAHEVGWFVKQSIYNEKAPGKPGYIYNCELVSTTYTP
jgi:hypothetical protein